MALQQVMGGFDQLGVECGLPFDNQLPHGHAGVAAHRQAHRALGDFLDLLACGADASAIGRVRPGRAGQHFGDRAGGAKTHGQRLDPGVGQFDPDVTLGQPTEQGQQVGRRFEVESGRLGRCTHLAHQCLHRAALIFEHGQHGIDGGDRALVARAVRVALDQPCEVVAAALQVPVLVDIEFGEGQSHQGLAVVKLGVQADACHAVKQRPRAIDVAGVKGHHGKVLQARHRVGRHVAGHLVGGLGLGHVTQLELGSGHHVVGVGKAGVFGNQGAERTGGGNRVTRGHHRPRHPEFGPGGSLGGGNGFVQFLGFGETLHAHQQLGTDPGGIEPECAARPVALQTQVGRYGVGLGLHGIKHLAERVFAVARQAQSLVQLVGLVRFEQVAVQPGFSGFRHPVVGGLAGQHEKHGVERELAFFAQFIDQVDARGRLAWEVVLTHDHVKCAVAELLACLRQLGALRDLVEAELAQLRRQDAPRQRTAVDDHRSGVGEIRFE
ncbi:MAG: hypothetical protein RIS90_889 [Pseudomonadota bacterium]